MWTIQSSRIGRIAVPQSIPDGFAVFCTSRDYQGRITPALASELTAVAKEVFGVTATLSTCVQVHGARVERVRSSKQWRECDSCDALWTDVTHAALGIKVADCLPVTMVDPSSAVIANAHSGWRGAVQRITAETVDVLTRSSAFDTASAHAYLGPSIRRCCFEVGEEVAEQFDPRYVDRSHARPHVDLIAFTSDILRERGFADERISDSGLCTRCDGSLFHSFRRDGKGGGRNLQIVAR